MQDKVHGMAIKGRPYNEDTYWYLRPLVQQAIGDNGGLDPLCDLVGCQSGRSSIANWLDGRKRKRDGKVTLRSLRPQYGVALMDWPKRQERYKEQWATVEKTRADLFHAFQESEDLDYAENCNDYCYAKRSGLLQREICTPNALQILRREAKKLEDTRGTLEGKFEIVYMPRGGRPWRITSWWSDPLPCVVGVYTPRGATLIAGATPGQLEALHQAARPTLHCLVRLTVKKARDWKGNGNGGVAICSPSPRFVTRL